MTPQTFEELRARVTYGPMSAELSDAYLRLAYSFGQRALIRKTFFAAGVAVAIWAAVYVVLVVLK